MIPSGIIIIQLWPSEELVLASRSLGYLVSSLLFRQLFVSGVDMDVVFNG